MPAARDVSNVDRDFLARLRRVVRAEQAKSAPRATDVVEASVDKTGMDRQLDERRRRWDVDGSIVLGRVDTSARERYYFGRRALHDENGELLVVSIRSALGKELWSGTDPSHPGRAILKRRFTISGWTVVDWSNDFDLRRRAPEPQARDDSPAVPTRKGTGGDLVAVMVALDVHGTDARTALEQALLQLDLGRPVSENLSIPIRGWNRALVAGARSMGIPEADVTREAIAREAEARLKRARLSFERREELDRKIAALDELIGGGTLGRDELVQARQALRDLRKSSRPRAL